MLKSQLGEHNCRSTAKRRNIMLLENKNAVIYGAAGAVGSAVAQAFAREGARLFLTGRDLGALDVLDKEITAAGGGVAAAGRARCLRTTGMEEPPTIDVVFGLHAQAYDITREDFAATMAAQTHRKRATTLTELADAAAFVASDRAAAMTGTVVNLTGGIIVD